MSKNIAPKQKLQNSEMFLDLFALVLFTHSLKNMLRSWVLESKYTLFMSALKLCLSVDEKVTQALQLLRGVGRLDLVVAGALPEMRPTHRASDCMQKRHV
ncbi:hypothetical protein NDU88_001413 [Pleurodeles waltl]|uniref:Uncharacterized protein n=1 Tax=Pleurodeles waltl TaxID=8319 RepID=A0AAV7SZG5_PLEWA|nr:hypothetical protein NDU88_001413 [Pleurodeles waltl]